MYTVKEKLMKIIQNGGGFKCGDDAGTFADIPCDGCRYEAAEDCTAARVVDALIEGGVTIQEWVSVDERLPEESGDYLVIANSGSIFRYYYSHEELEFGEYVEIELDFVEKPDTVWISLDTITHWMPIPALPKGVQ